MYKPRHARPGSYKAAAAVAGIAAITALAVASPANASESSGGRALDWAETHALNASYSWGASGPYSYDCSGIVMKAFEETDGIYLPHNTTAMIDSGKLVRVWGTPQRGDLAFWGPVSSPYHVEFVTSWSDTTFGAETYGWDGRVTWHSYYPGWAPSAFYRVGG